MSKCPSDQELQSACVMVSKYRGEQVSVEQVSGEQMSGEQLTGERLTGEQLSVNRSPNFLFLCCLFGIECIYCRTTTQTIY